MILEINIVFILLFLLTKLLYQIVVAAVFTHRQAQQVA